MAPTERLSLADAKSLDKRIRSRFNNIRQEMDELQVMLNKAREGEIWETLGFPSWTAYLADVVNIDIKGANERREMVAVLIPETLSQRAVAKMLNVDQATISRDWKSVMQSRSGDANASRQGEVEVEGDELASYAPMLDSPKYVRGLDGKEYPVGDEPQPTPKDPDLVRQIKRATRNAKRLCELLVDIYANPEWEDGSVEIVALKAALAVALSYLEKHLWPTRAEITAKQRKPRRKPAEPKATQ